METVDNSVMMVGLLPAYGALARQQGLCDGRDDLRLDVAARSSRGTTSIPTPCGPRRRRRSARPFRTCRTSTAATPSSATISTISSRASRTTPSSCCRRAGTTDQGGLFDGFAGLPVRKVVRPTRFYYMLLQRLQESSQHGRRRDLVGASGLPGQAGGLGETRPIHYGRCSAPNARRSWR